MSEGVLPRVFISSVMNGFEKYRDAAAQGIIDAGGEAVRVESFPSLHVSPRVACLDAIASCDAVLVIIGQRPGFKAPSGLYVVEEEWQFARKRSRPLYAFVQEADLEPDAARIAAEVSGYVHGRFRRTFRTPEELRKEVGSALNGIRSTMTEKLDATRLIGVLSKKYQGGYETLVRLAIQPVRETELIDPLELDSRAFQNALLQLGTEGEAPLFSLRAKKSVFAAQSALRFDQADESGRDPEQWRAQAEVSTNGLIVAERAAAQPQQRGWSDSVSLGLALKLSDLEAATISLFQFVSAVYNRVDPFIACRDFIYNVAIVNLGMRYIYDALPTGGGGIPMRMSDNDNIPAFDSPRPLVREALNEPTDEVARAVALLRRRAQPGV